MKSRGIVVFLMGVVTVCFSLQASKRGDEVVPPLDLAATDVMTQDSFANILQDKGNCLVAFAQTGKAPQGGFLPGRYYSAFGITQHLYGQYAPIIVKKNKQFLDPYNRQPITNVYYYQVNKDGNKEFLGDFSCIEQGYRDDNSVLHEALFEELDIASLCKDVHTSATQESLQEFIEFTQILQKRSCYSKELDLLQAAALLHKGRLDDVFTFAYYSFFQSLWTGKDAAESTKALLNVGKYLPGGLTLSEDTEKALIKLAKIKSENEGTDTAQSAQHLINWFNGLE